MARKILRLLENYDIYNDSAEDLKVFLNGAANAYGMVPLRSLLDIFNGEFQDELTLWKMTVGGLLLETETGSQFCIMTEADLWIPEEGEPAYDDSEVYLVNKWLLKDNHAYSVLNDLWDHRDLAAVKKLSRDEYMDYSQEFKPLDNPQRDKLFRFLRKNSRMNAEECTSFLNDLELSYRQEALLHEISSCKDDPMIFFNKFKLKSDGYLLGLRQLLDDWIITLSCWANRGYSGKEVEVSKPPVNHSITVGFLSDEERK